MAEQLALGQRFRQRGAVDGDEAGGAASAEGMDVSRDDFLARATFPLNQDGDIGIGHLPQIPADGGHGLGLAEENALGQAEGRNRRRVLNILSHGRVYMCSRSASLSRPLHVM